MTARPQDEDPWTVLDQHLPNALRAAPCCGRGRGGRLHEIGRFASCGRERGNGRVVGITDSQEEE